MIEKQARKSKLAKTVRYRELDQNISHQKVVEKKPKA